MAATLDELAAAAGVTWFDYQVDVLTAEADTPAASQRICLYYKTGAGKSITSLALLAQKGYTSALVITPPSTYDTWIQQGKLLGIDVQPMSHAKFRMAGTKLDRHKPVIADEFHQFGGHGGKGWKKLDRLAAGIQAPLILASATPNYNDADRVYCIQHILDPLSCRGGFLEFLYQHCVTEHNPFGMMPNVTGFRNFENAAEYLASLPHVYYVEDDLTYDIVDVGFPNVYDVALDTFGYDRQSHRLMASQIEERHLRVFRSLVDYTGHIRSSVYGELLPLLDPPTLVFANHATVADALGKTLHGVGMKHAVVTGTTPAKKKQAYIDAFRDGVLDVLVGTASLATGTDGLDKVCDTLVILDDTDDPSLRRQLIGRIMPRGASSDASKKKVYRLHPL